MKRKASKKVLGEKAKEALIEDLYYEAMELIQGTKKDHKDALDFLDRALRVAPNNVLVHIGFTDAYGIVGKNGKAKEHIHTAYENTILQFKKWPKKMPWAVLENRPFLRALQYEADLSADAGENEKAIEIYRRLLSLNPHDNQGVRYTLSGLYAGISGREINQMNDEGNRKQNWDTLERLVEEQNKKHKFWKKPRI